MKSSARLGFGLVVVGSLFAFAGCGDDDDAPSGTAGKASHSGGEGGGGGGAHTDAGAAHGGGGHGDAALVCKVLGELCHAADSGAGPASECHEVGHVGDGEACEAEFDGCIEVCVDSGSGAGGAGGSPARDPYCAALGELCHAVDDENGPTHACHELGHVNDAAECAAKFAECATLCLAKRDELEEQPAGGAGAGGGGAGGVSGGAGGAPTLGGAGGAGGSP